MLKIYLTRHGETEWNTKHRLQGKQDSNLTELGVRQAHQLAKRLENITFNAIYSSSSGRAANTAQILKGDRELRVNLRDELMEIHLADWEGKDKDEIETLYPQATHDFWYQPHLYQREEGETFYDVQNRAVACLDEIVQEHVEGNILVVTHAVVIKALLTYFEKREMKTLWSEPYIRQTSLSIIELCKGNYNVSLSGDISHYDGEHPLSW